MPLSSLFAKGARKALGASRKARKSTGKRAADTMTPASVAKPMSQSEAKLKGTGTPTSEDIPSYKITAAVQKKKGKALTKKIKEQEAYEEKRDSLKGKDKLLFIHKNQDKVQLRKASIKDMKRRDIVPMKAGGKVIKASTFGNDLVRHNYD